MWAWIAALIAALLWGILLYFWGGQFQQAGRDVAEAQVGKQLEEFFDTPEGTRERMLANPNDPVPALKWAELARQSGDDEEYAKRIEANAIRFPREFHSNIALARLFWDAGDNKRLRRVLGKLSRLYPLNIHLMALQFRAAERARAFSRAKRLGYRMIKIHPTNSYSYSILAGMLLELNELEAVEKILLIADREMPDNKEIPGLWEQLEARLQSKHGNPAPTSDEVGPSGTA